MIALGTQVLYTVLLAQAGWTASGGRETFTYRDIVRSGPPADASPVEWTGRGPSLFIVHERANARRAHRFTIDLAEAGSFSYDGPVRAIAAPDADRATRFEGRYEYRRYFLRDRLLRGLDAGVSLQTGGRWLTMTRQMGTATLRMSSTAALVGGVLSARFHRWARWSAEIGWTNGLTFLREHDSHSADALSEAHLWGGGWLTDLTMSGSVRVSRRASISASFLSTGEGVAVSHHNFAFARRRFAIGVAYDR